MTDTPEAHVCHRCGALLTTGNGSFYVIRIEAFADPTPPADVPATAPVDLTRLIDEMREMSEQELMDQVYRRLTLLLCRRCYEAWIERPAG